MLRLMKERREQRGEGDDLVGVDDYSLETCIVHMAILILTLSYTLRNQRRGYNMVQSN